MNVDNQIKGIISELFGMYPTDDDTFDSLLMDDFDKIELFDTISEEYAIDFPDDVFNGIVSVKGLITYIEMKFVNK